MRLDDWAEAADANFVVHAAWPLQRTRGMRVVESADLVLTDSGLPSDTFNVACRARFTPQEAALRILDALAFFEEVGRPFSWWVGPADQPANLGELLVDAGLHAAETELAMGADLAGLPLNNLVPPGLVIRRVLTAADLRDFAQVIAAPHERRFYRHAAAAMVSADSPQQRYVGYLDGLPVATSELTLGGGVAGLYNIATLEPYRRRGIGTALTLQPLLDARDRGFSIGVLQAAAGGVSVYTRLGFRAFGDITEYKHHR